jgi:hypothetical protein
MVLFQLAETGSDLQKPHLPEFAFEVESKAVAQAIASELASLDFDVELHLNRPGFRGGQLV